jgi:hypothetical protein
LNGDGDLEVAVVTHDYNLQVDAPGCVRACMCVLGGWVF